MSWRVPKRIPVLPKRKPFPRFQIRLSSDMRSLEREKELSILQEPMVVDIGSKSRSTMPILVRFAFQATLDSY